MKKNQTDGHVFVFPARISEVDGKKLYYLFSIRQVAEVLSNADVQPVPFAHAHADGVTRWRGRILPVMSLENCMGIDLSGDQNHVRTIVIRAVTRDRDDALHESHTVFQVGAAIRQINLPLICEPARIPEWVTNASVVSGVYQLKDRLYMVMNVEAILNANHPRSRYVS